MKREILIGCIIIGLTLMSTGCSKTWQGMKQDTYTLWNGTKQVIHESTK